MSYPGPYRPPLSGWGTTTTTDRPASSALLLSTKTRDSIHHTRDSIHHLHQMVGAVTAHPPYQYYFPGTMMIPVPRCTNARASYRSIWTKQIPTSRITSTKDSQGSVLVAESSGELDWVPTTSTLSKSLTGRAVAGGMRAGMEVPCG
ncbi:unnamed protein product [Arctia plantaginis]|uniref:Uncharacterized protein n=1 Tax=Arctia plantaginis TaxID=874455 RepID=A0A8S1BMV2_ARCPL|nr:unnamed protein product [Arctia plantaginis]